MNDRYVILTGGKNNAGDFLIKHRAKSLLANLRPDREVIDYDGWKTLDDEKLETINTSRALILTGGPALQLHMYPRIYPLVDDLNRIKVPILTMAIGWKGKNGTWEEAYNYPLGSKTLHLLERIESSGYMSSVRDYHTQSALRHHGFKKFLVTGCTALYSMEHLTQKFHPTTEINRLTFSVGVSFFKNQRFAEVNQKLIAAIRNMFPASEFTVAFHHSTRPETYKKTHNPNLKLLEGQLALIDWLNGERIDWKDLSGSAETMLDHYMDSDLHIGYRVHAHILMASILKPTVLIAEDGRGTALHEVLGGIVFDGCAPALPGILGWLQKCLRPCEGLMAAPELVHDLPYQVKMELENKFPRASQNHTGIQKHYPVMRQFIESLP